MKTIDHRVAYFIRKTAQYCTQRTPRHLRSPYRYNRLKAYKDALDQRIKAEIEREVIK